MPNDITLPVGVSAEHGTCGSCHFFRRTMGYGAYAMSRGLCGFRLPPTLDVRFARMARKDDDEDRFLLPDTEGCDLYQPDRKVYIVQRRVGGSSP